MHSKYFWRCSHIVLIVLNILIFPNAFAVGECNSNSFGVGTTPCCSTTNMVGGGLCYIPADTTFQFTIVRFGFEKSDGSVVTLGSNTLFNAASADAGNVIGNFISNGSLPAGTYVAVRPTIHISTTVNNTAVTTPDGRTCTAGSTTADFSFPIGLSVCAAGQPNSVVESCKNASDNNLVEIRDSSLGTINYDGSSLLQIAFTFNTGNGVGCSFAPGAGGTQASKIPGILRVTMTLL